MSIYRVTSDQDTERIEFIKGPYPKYCAMQAWHMFGKKDMQVTVQEGTRDENGIFTSTKKPLTYQLTVTRLDCCRTKQIEVRLMRSPGMD